MNLSYFPYVFLQDLPKNSVILKNAKPLSSEDTINKLAEQLDLDQTTHSAEIVKIKQNCQVELDTLKSETFAEFEQLRDQLRLEQERAKLTEDTIIKLKADYETEQNDHLIQVNQIKEDYKLELEKLENEKKSDFEQLLEEHNLALKMAELKYDELAAKRDDTELGK